MVKVVQDYSFFFSFSAASIASLWSSLIATMTYPTNTTFARKAAVAPEYVELPGLVSGVMCEVLLAWEV
jgi:hypothetical protein